MSLELAELAQGLRDTAQWIRAKDPNATNFIYCLRAANVLALLANPGEDVVEKARDKILANLRGRKLLKYLFDEEPDNCGPYGYVEAPIDLETQNECAESLARAALSSLAEAVGL